MTCPCKNPAHDYDKLFTSMARYLLERPDETRHIWANWSDPTHRNRKSAAFLARVKDCIRKLKTEAA